MQRLFLVPGSLRFPVVPARKPGPTVMQAMKLWSEFGADAKSENARQRKSGSRLSPGRRRGKVRRARMTRSYSLVLERQRHLKWRALDPLEQLLMVLCGVALAGFTSTVFFD